MLANATVQIEPSVVRQAGAAPTGRGPARAALRSRSQIAGVAVGH